MELASLLQEMLDRNATDLHLVTGTPPVLRINMQLTACKMQNLEAGIIEEMMQPHLSEAHQIALNNREDVNLSLAHNNRKMRCHLFRERGNLCLAARVIPGVIPALSSLFTPNIERVFRALLEKRRGLILCAGPTGSGKYTTINSLLETINLERSERILTIEDVPEYDRESKMSLVSQRIVGEDVDSFEQGGLSALRSDPDIILIGELRTAEAVRIALTLAETGHLVFTTLQAESVSEAVQRIMESFPEPRDTTRRMLARNVVAITAQRLLKRDDKPGRVSVNEILIANARVRKLIVEGQTDLTMAIEAGRDEGMQTMDDSVLEHYRAGRINYETAWSAINDYARLGPPRGEQSTIKPYVAGSQDAG